MWPFAIPGFWLLSLAAAVAVQRTAWGRSGHPSNGLALLFFVMISAPVFGLTGLAATFLGNRSRTRRNKLLAIVANALVTAVGAAALIWIFSPPQR